MKNKINKQTSLFQLGLRQKGFTLIELLIVVSIIAILVAITSSSFLNSQKRSRDSLRKTELKELSDALNMYYADNGKYPEDSDIKINELIMSQGEFADTSNSNNKIVYMKKVPKGNASNMKEILYVTTGKAFRLFTNLENVEDKDCIAASVCKDLGYSVSSGCCFIITSSNLGNTEALN